MTTDSQQDALRAALAAALPHRLVTRCYVDASNRSAPDLQAGVFTLISKSERDYRDFPGRPACEGTLDVALLFQIQPSLKADGLQVEQSELQAIDEIKGFISDLPPALAAHGNLSLRGWTQSGQLEAPDGWVIFHIEWYLN